MNGEVCDATQVCVLFRFVLFFCIVLCFLASITVKGRCLSTSGGRIAADENKNSQALTDYNGIVEAGYFFCFFICFEHNTSCRPLYMVGVFLHFLVLVFLPSGRIFLSCHSLENTL